MNFCKFMQIEKQSVIAPAYIGIGKYELSIRKSDIEIGLLSRFRATIHTNTSLRACKLITPCFSR